MSFLQLRKEIQGLKDSVITQYHEPQCKTFIFKIGGLVTTEGLTAADVDEYEKKHPYNMIMSFYWLILERRINNDSTAA